MVSFVVSRAAVVPLAVMVLAVAALAACDGGKPASSPENTASSAEAATPSAKDKDDPPAATTAEAVEAPPGAPRPDVPKGLSIDAYEMTPSDCNALGRHYGEVARSDQVAQLSPKLNDKQRSATMEQIDKVVGKLEESWTNGCHGSLVNHAVDHDAIKCALAAKTVHNFDVCINGATGTPDPGPQKPKKKK